MVNPGYGDINLRISQKVTVFKFDVLRLAYWQDILTPPQQNRKTRSSFVGDNKCPLISIP
jgi:hypothetical protein